MSRKRPRGSGVAATSPAASPPPPPPRPRRAWWKPALAAAALIAVLAAGGLYVFTPRLPGTPPPAHPNVLLVTIDTLRADRLGSYGYAGAATPHLDDLAAKGARFETALAQAPLTTPSHASILTGLTPPRHGVRDNGQALGAGPATLAEALRAGGYATGAFVSGFPLDRRFGLARGFDAYDDRLPHGDDPRRAAYVERRGEATTAAALAWLDAQPPQRPWFAWVHYFEPHAPYEPPDALRARFAGRPYDGEVAAVDAQVGALLEHLDQTGARAHTVVLVTSDHGESLGEHGEETHGVFVYAATLRVPLIVAGPGVRAGVVATRARSVDIAPTLIDLAHVAAPPASMEGRSLRPAMDGRAMEERPAYGESLFTRLNLGWAPLHAWRSGRYTMVDAPRPELYDTSADPGETHDVAGAHPEVVEAMRRELRAALDAAPAPPAAPAAPDVETARRLAALGYLGGAARGDGAGPGRDPKDGIGLVNRLEHAIAEARARPRWAADELGAILAQDEGLALAHRYRAIALAAAGDPAAAAREVEALDRSGSARADDLVLMAECLRLAGRGPQALAVLDRAEALQPGLREGALTRAQVLAAQGRAAEAAAAYERVLAADPHSGAALRGLGDLALARGDVAAAEGYFARVLRQEPQDGRALLKLGIAQARTGRIDMAVPTLRQAVAADPGNADASLALAGALARSGRAAEAVPYFERAVAAGSRTTAALNGLGFARLESGDRRGALESLRASLAIEPRQPGVAQAVGDITRALRAAGR